MDLLQQKIANSVQAIKSTELIHIFKKPVFRPRFYWPESG
jgi:hypothetical protein